ncbi:hypothetical protein [Thermoflexus sp.]|uniref:hypothetical protein n=1 Tax=Thermoflexus sp. TaxID=1969742 RepID=UPI003C0B9B88
MVLRRWMGAGLMALLLALSFSPRSSAAPVVPPRKGPPLSQPALFSRFARENELGAEDLAELIRWEAQQAALEALSPAALQANADWNRRPQNETTIATHPTLTNTWVIGANDYGIGVPIGTGVYSSEGGK